MVFTNKAQHKMFITGDNFGVNCIATIIIMATLDKIGVKYEKDYHIKLYNVFRVSQIFVLIGEI